MKKFFIGLVLLTGFIVSANAKEHLFFQGKYGEYNEYSKSLTLEDYAIKYDDEEDVFYLRTSDWMNNAWTFLTRDDLAQLRKNFEKYFEWEKLAVEKQTTIEKEIPDSKINTRVVWEFGDDWYSYKGFTLSFIFFSQDANRHQLVLLSNKATSSNQFVTFQIEGFYFDKSQIQELYDAISEENIEAKIKEIQNQKDMEDLFN